MRKWLTEIRTEMGLTYKELSAKVGLPESYLCNLEKGKLKARGMNVELLIKIAQALNLDPMEVLRMEIEYLKS